MVGPKIHHLRKDKGLTLKELASASGLSISFLSQVERDLASPTVTSISSIAKALDVATSYFFPPPSPKSLIVRSYERQPFNLTEGSEVYAKLGSDLPETQLAPIFVTYPPRYENTKWQANHEEFIYVLKGQLILMIDGEEHRLNGHDSMHYFSEYLEKVENPHTTPCQAILVRGQLL